MRKIRSFGRDVIFMSGREKKILKEIQSGKLKTRTTSEEIFKVVKNYNDVLYR